MTLRANSETVQWNTARFWSWYQTYMSRVSGSTLGELSRDQFMEVFKNWSWSGDGLSGLDDKAANQTTDNKYNVT